MRERGRELRRAKRTPRRNAAWIGLGNGGTHVPCVLWDISDSGARVAAPRSNLLPAAFNLILSKDGSAQRRCRVVWRNSGQVGVQFVEASDDDDEAASPFRRLPKVATAPPVAQHASSPVDTASLVLPGYGPQFLEQRPKRGIPISSVAAGMLLMLIAATAMFLAAGMQLDAPWAAQLCAGAANFCEHPEWTGAAAGLMAVVYFTIRGMEE
jgi:hypothetical protein